MRDVEAGADHHCVRQLHRHRRLHVDALERRVIAEETRLARVWPVRRQTVRREQADAERHARGRDGHIHGRRVVGVLAERADQTGRRVGEAAARRDRFAAEADHRPRCRRERRRVEEHGRPVVARRGDAGAVAAHHAGALFVQAEALGARRRAPERKSGGQQHGDSRGARPQRGAVFETHARYSRRFGRDQAQVYDRLCRVSDARGAPALVNPVLWSGRQFSQYGRFFPCRSPDRGAITGPVPITRTHPREG